MAHERLQGQERLLAEEITPFAQGQIDQFTPESVRLTATPAYAFDFRTAPTLLASQEGEKVLAFDMGGDTFHAAVYQAENRVPVLHHDFGIFQSSQGARYLEKMERVCNEVPDSMRVGVSFAGPLDDTRPVEAPNMGEFVTGLQKFYGGDFANMFKKVSVVNDAVSGAIRSTMEVTTNHKAKSLLYLINGSGFGGSVGKDCGIYAAEPGHVPVTKVYNPFKVTRACSPEKGRMYTCIERIAASKAGIEAIWKDIDTRAFTGREISEQFVMGHPLAYELYRNAADLTALVAKGLGDTATVLEQPKETALVIHGGITHVPGIAERIRAVARQNIGQLSVLFTRDFDQNACLTGAAYAAFMLKS